MNNEPRIEDFDRGNLSGHVSDISGDMVRVRFSEASDHPGSSGTFRLVTRVDGSLAIDPSGLAVPQHVRDELEARKHLEFGSKLGISDRAVEKMTGLLPPPDAEVVDADPEAG